MLFFTADQHLGHARIIELCGRPFASVEEMNESLIERWNQTVSPDDTVYVLGDWAMGRIKETLPLTRRCNGSKILIPGNHDRVWMGHEEKVGLDKIFDWQGDYLNAGFSAIMDSYPYNTQSESLADHGNWHDRDDDHWHNVLLHHFPYKGDSHDKDRYVHDRPIDMGGWLLHGHVHERWRQRGRMINVGVDAWSGFPVSEATIASMIVDGERDLPPLEWQL